LNDRDVKEFSLTERRRITTMMQFHLLDGLMQSAAWGPQDLIFRGGSSLRYALGSYRFSEGLDLLVLEQTWPLLANALARSSRNAQEALAMELPGARISVEERDSGRSVMPFAAICTHPRRGGAVEVGLNFMPGSMEALDSYETMIVPLRSPGVRFSPMATVGSARMLYLDKMFALGLREEVAAHDIFDLWWLRVKSGVGMPDEAFLLKHALAAEEIYDCDAREVLARLGQIQGTPASELEKLLVSGLPDVLSTQAFVAMRDKRLFEDMTRFVRADAEKVSKVMLRVLGYFGSVQTMEEVAGGISPGR